MGMTINELELKRIEHSMELLVKARPYPVDDLIPYERNQKDHDERQIKNVANSLRRFGWRQPVVMDERNVIVIGHCRVLAAKRLGLDTAPVISAEDLTEDEIRELRIADNKTNESPWNSYFDEDVKELEFEGFEFNYPAGAEKDFFSREERNDTSKQEDNDEYNEFLDKFEHKKTTDDCYTPEIVYNAIAEWVTKEYGIDRLQFVRPFYPGGDYKKYSYPSGCAVVDNPPFSILAEIISWYA